MLALLACCDDGAGGVADAGSGSGGDDGNPPSASVFTVQVEGGYGAGTYAAGETVHVWSAASTTQAVVLPWTGDASLLAEPLEWHTTFIMPERDVTLVANSQDQALTLIVEQYKGSTGVAKTVRYFFPPDMRGVVILSHGTGGNSRFIESTEAFALALALVSDGYGVLSTEAEEAVAGDLNGDGKERWRTVYTKSNIDLQNLQILFDDFEARGLIPTSTPKFALGMSNGGAFSHFLGTVSATSVASSFPQLRFNAVVAYCADATQTDSGTLSTTPSAWFMCGAEDNPEVSNKEARANEQALRERGFPTDYVEHPPSPIYDERFTRIAGISADTSRAMVAELRAADFVDADGFVTADADQIAAAVVNDPASFPTISMQTDALSSIRSQVKAMRAEHAMYADYTQRNLAFFDRFNPRP